MLWGIWHERGNQLRLHLEERVFGFGECVCERNKLKFPPKNLMPCECLGSDEDSMAMAPSPSTIGWRNLWLGMCYGDHGAKMNVERMWARLTSVWFMCFRFSRPVTLASCPKHTVLYHSVPYAAMNRHHFLSWDSKTAVISTVPGVKTAANAKQGSIYLPSHAEERCACAAAFEAWPVEDGWRMLTGTLWWTNIAIENGHRNSGFSQK